MTEAELKQIKQDFDQIITYSQGIEEPKTDKLFEIWRECKKDYIKAFGDKCIYEMPGIVSFELDDKEKQNRIDNFINLVENQWYCSELAHFVDEQREGFFKNLSVSDYTTSSGKLIKKGSKLVRAFRHFLNTDSRKLTDIQNEASRVIQENKIEGKMCLSVHPLDFLSLSENTYNWRSCHALDGDYRAGNLSYMMDCSTIICYLKSSDNVNLPAFGPEVPWNSKKWRVLLYFSNDKKMLFAGRQYPFSSRTGLDMVLRDVLPSVGLCRLKQHDFLPDFTYQWTNWSDFTINTFDVGDINFQPYNYYLLGNELKELSDFVIDVEGSCQFNDVLNSSCYKPLYSFEYENADTYSRPYALTSSSTKFNIGGATYCLRCGKELCVSNGGGSMMCVDCELKYGNSESDAFTYCGSCGRRILYDDGEWVEDEIWCEHCCQKYAKECEVCGRVLSIDNIYYHNETEQYVCEHCLDELNDID